MMKFLKTKKLHSAKNQRGAHPLASISFIDHVRKRTSRKSDPRESYSSL